MSKKKRQNMQRGDEEWEALMQPLYTALDRIKPGSSRTAKAIAQKETQGVLAWGAQSGYLLWVRTHPGQIPTRAQVQAWMRTLS